MEDNATFHHMRTAKSQVREVMKHYPNLTYQGFFVPEPRETIQDQKTRLARHRADMNAPESLKEFRRCQEFVVRVLNIQATKGEDISSYYLKHVVEDWGSLDRRPLYVSNGMMIAAMTKNHGGVCSAEFIR